MLQKRGRPSGEMKSAAKVPRKRTEGLGLLSWERRPRGATASKRDTAKEEAMNDPLHLLQIKKEAKGLNGNKGNVG